MTTYELTYCAAALLLAGTVGLEGRLNGERWSFVAAFGAMAAGYGLAAANNAFALCGLGIPDGAFGPTAAICLASIAVLEWLAPRRRDASTPRGGQANHFVALAFGVGAATQEGAIFVAGFAQMLALFVGRAESGGEAVAEAVEGRLPIDPARDGIAVSNA